MQRLMVVLAVVSLFAAGCGSSTLEQRDSQGDTTRPGAQTKPGAQQRSADAAPDFSVTTFTGDRFALGDHKGTPVVLNFWESW